MTKEKQSSSPLSDDAGKDTIELQMINSNGRNPNGVISGNLLMLNDNTELNNKRSSSYRSADSSRELEFQVVDKRKG